MILSIVFYDLSHRMCEFGEFYRCLIEYQTARIGKISREITPVNDLPADSFPKIMRHAKRPEKRQRIGIFSSPAKSAVITVNVGDRAIRLRQLLHYAGG